MICNAAAREFPHSQYAMVLHTFETDPGPHPARHPHVHLTVKAAGLDGTRLNPRKPDLQRWREGFADALREQGIETTNTTGVDRTKRETRVPRIQREVMQTYKQVMNALASSDQGDDRQLAADLVRHFTGRSRVREEEKGRDRERE